MEQKICFSAAWVPALLLLLRTAAGQVNAGGRTLSAPGRDRNIVCAWQQWVDRDDASATGDWETIRDWPVEGRCNKVGTWPDNVLAIEARRVSDKRPPSQTGDVIAAYDTKTGFGCANRDQPGGGRCDDYEARLCCQIRCRWLPWTDRDDPTATGDWESIGDWPQDRRCPGTGWPHNVDKIQARRKSDRADPSITGDVIRHYDRVRGFACVNEDQPNGHRCDDYEVRICCN